MKQVDRISKSNKLNFLRKKIPPLAYIFLSFASVIIVGSILLVLPISVSKPSSQLSYIDALFTATSAVCVTGLSTIPDISLTFSVFGKIVLCLLIQIGGLGLVTILSFVMLIGGRKIKFSNVMIVKESLSQSTFAHLVPIIVSIVITTAIFEAGGTIMNMFVFTQDYSFWEALGISFFHAVSSFNNCGYDIIGSVSMIAYKDNILLNFSTCFLVICGGIGFLVINDIFALHRWRRFSIQTKVVLIVNGIILVSSVILIKALQWNNISFMQAIFYSVNIRTAGFSTFDLKSTLHSSTIILSMLLMFIGGSPLSTAGGIKTTTFLIIVTSIISYARGKRAVIFKREITPDIRFKAFMLVIFSLIGITTCALLVFLFEGDKFDFQDVLFECFSAFGTVGLSLGITTQISTSSKIMLCLLMYFGRIGPVSLLNIWTPRINKPEEEDVSYLYTDIMVG